MNLDGLVLSIGTPLTYLTFVFYHVIEGMLLSFDISPADITLKLGLGQIEFFSLSLEQLLIIMISVVVWYVFIRYIYRLIKSIFGLVTRWFR